MAQALADANVPDSHGHTPLLWAAFRDRDKLMDMLLRNGASPEMCVGIEKCSICPFAADATGKAVRRCTGARGTRPRGAWSCCWHAVRRKRSMRRLDTSRFVA